jgi:hypothetical protein
MTSTANHHDNDIRGERRRLDGLAPRNWPRPRLRRTMTAGAALVGLVVIAAGCGGSKSPGVAGAGGGTAGGGSSSGVVAKFEAYSHCMRSHGIRDFPDPTTRGGGVGISLHGGPGSDLDRNNPRFKAANQACQSLMPGGSLTPQQSSQKIAAEVKWAQCMRSHGLPSVPDPNGQGAFDRSKFDESSPAFQSASTACQSLMKGPVPVAPGG